MKILFVSPDPRPERWINLLEAALPQAEWIVWHPELPCQEADYALVWQPPEILFKKEPQLKAIFNLGAGVDVLLKLSKLPKSLPIYRLEDAGMSAQMAEYLIHQVAEITRVMPVYRQQQQDKVWRMQSPCRRHEWPIGFLGMGQIAQKAAKAFSLLEYPVAGWSRSEKRIEGIDSYYGDDQITKFVQRSRILINTLPLTSQTQGFLNQSLFDLLPEKSIVINVGRGQHLNEMDLLNALEYGRVSHAILDVFSEEPLPKTHPFWNHPKITLTPHISAPTLRDETVKQIAEKIQKLASGEVISGQVDRNRGY